MKIQTDYLTVTALTKYLKRKFDADPYLERVHLTGEISNFRFRPNGHQYFSLKDEKAKIAAVMFRQAFDQLKFQPKEGMKVLVVGRISLYEASGQYQIYVDHMEPDGVGALYQALAEMREKLAKEGLFTAPKKTLPRFPKRIAVITSPSGAVIRDIITTVKRRYPVAELVLFPTLVQGEKAADDLVRNIQRAEALGNFDTMIIARGGGSIEDLWPFNEERVARAIYATEIPVISSVGHETDTTIADLVADVRAATPTAAAELAVPVLTEEILKIKERENALIQRFSALLRHKKQNYDNLAQSYIFKQPERLYQGFSMKLDLLEQRFAKASQELITNKKEQFVHFRHRLLLTAPKNQIRENQQTIQFLTKQLTERMGQIYLQKQQKLQTVIESLDLLSPLKTMSRGYTYTTKKNQVIKSASEIKAEDSLMIHFYDGQVEAVVNNIMMQESEEK